MVTSSAAGSTFRLLFDNSESYPITSELIPRFRFVKQIKLQISENYWTEKKENIIDSKERKSQKQNFTTKVFNKNIQMKKKKINTIKKLD